MIKTIAKAAKNNFGATGVDQRGIVLIVTLIILSVLLSTALGFGIFIFSDIRQAQAIDNSILAYYAADAGLERSLFLFRQNDVQWVGSPEQPGTLLDVLGTADATLKNNAQWNVANSHDYEETFFRQRLNSGQSVKLYFLNRASEPRLNQADKIAVEWYKGKKASGVASDVKMQLSFTQLNPELKYDAAVDDSPIVVYYTDFSPEQEISDYLVTQSPQVYSFLDETVPYCYPEGSGCSRDYYDYVVEIKALGLDSVSEEPPPEENDGNYIDSLKVTAYDENNQRVIDGITNITIRSVGTYRRAEQEIIANIPPRDPVSGLLGFVLFSEEDITKGY